MNQQQLTGLSDTHLSEVKTRHQTLNLDARVTDNLIDLVNAADREGFQLEIASGFRGFERQKSIWNRKFLGQIALKDENSKALDFASLSDRERVYSILRWSALPGASRHHWGTDLDIYAKNLLPQNTALLLEPWEYLEGHQAPFFQWLTQNLEQFGFFFPYKKDLGGVAPEPWHISHKMIAKTYQDQLSKSLLLQVLKNEGVLGLDTLSPEFENIYHQYITNICKDE